MRARMFIAFFFLVAPAFGQGSARGSTDARQSEDHEKNGHWWLLLTSEEKSGYLNGDADCYQFELNKKFASPKPAAEEEEFVTTFYQSNPDKRSLPVYEVIRIADRQPRLRPPAKGGEVWNERHGYWDGQWWREGTPADRLGFVEGYVACYSRSQKVHGTLSRTTREYVGLINEWYKLNEETGDVDPDRVDTKIVDVLFRFVDSAAMGALPTTGRPPENQTESTSHYPNLIRADLPLYPPLAWTAHISGRIEIQATIERGSVVDAQVKSFDIEIIDPQNHALYDSSAKTIASRYLSEPSLANLKTWKFQSEDRATFLVTYLYKIEGEETPLPENPRIELDLPRLVKVTAKPFKPTCSDCGAQN